MVKQEYNSNVVLNPQYQDYLKHHKNENQADAPLLQRSSDDL